MKYDEEYPGAIRLETDEELKAARVLWGIAARARLHTHKDESDASYQLYLKHVTSYATTMLQHPELRPMDVSFRGARPLRELSRLFESVPQLTPDLATNLAIRSFRNIKLEQPL